MRYVFVSNYTGRISKMDIEEMRSAINCAKQCVIQPTSERIIGQMFDLLKKRDQASLNYAQAVRLASKSMYANEVMFINEQIKNLLFIP